MTQCQKVRIVGVGFLAVNKICFKHFVLLLLCVCVHNWSISQWKQYMSSKSGAAGAIFIFESKKRHGIQPLKMDALVVSAFDDFIHIHDDSKYYLSHRFVQRRYRFTQCI